MNRLQLFFLLREHVKLSNKRHPMFEANQWGKLFGYIMVAILTIEFIALGTFFGWLAATEVGPEFIFYTMPFLLIFDFGGRFMAQQTPTMLVKPYLLTPISKYTAIDCFLIQQVLDLGNLLWMTFFLPYAFIVFCGGLTLWQTVGLLALLHLMVLVNSQWYLLVRTLVNQSMWWWLLPAAFYGLFILPLFVLPDEWFDRAFDVVGEVIEPYVFSWWTAGLFLMLFIVLFTVNRRLQMTLVYNEVSQKQEANLKRVSEFQALNRFGQIGEYLKLEIKSTMRNKAIRTRFIQGVCFIAFFSLVIAFTSTYNSSLERNFWCLYAFIFFGSANLTKVMCPEGNYIDLLMVHRENTLTLLRAKYYYYCAVLALPLLITLIPVITGKFSLIMVLAYLFTATGPVYAVLFQMAVYNKMTLPLNDKITGKNQMENKWQAIVSMASMIVPLIVVFVMRALFSEEAAYWALFLQGVAVTLCEPLWMRNIYRRMMLRRYDNLEGFRATR